MKKLTTAALLVGGAILACQSSFGQTYSSTPNDLLFGFENQAGGGSADYIINLGEASSIVGQSSVVDLSSDFSSSDFDTVLGSSSSMFGGVIGAANNDNSGTANTADVFVTQLRSGGAGTASIAGSSLSEQLSRSEDNTTFSAISGGLLAPTAGPGTLDSGKSWESEVEPGALGSGQQGAFESQTGVNPDSAVGSSGILYEDLWESSSSSLTGTQPFTYLGYFTLNPTADSLTFTGVNVVPEPGAYSIFAVGGLLVLALRNKLTRKNS